MGWRRKHQALSRAVHMRENNIEIVYLILRGSHLARGLAVMQFFMRLLFYVCVCGLCNMFVFSNWGDVCTDVCMRIITRRTAPGMCVL